MTRKRKKLRSVLLDSLVVIICLSAFFFSLKYFFIELNRNTVRTDITSIGQLQYKYKVAQRKFEDRVVWERLQQNSTLYNGDIIRTASQAAAGITFSNGSVLELGENTMIQIFITEDGDFVISLDSGTVAVESSAVENNSQVSLQMKNGSEVTLKPGVSFAVETTENGESSFTVKQGEVTVTDDSGLEQQMTEGESFKQTKDGKLSQKAVSATSPSRVLNFEQKPVQVNIDLKVTDEYKSDNLIVETSDTPDFTNIQSTYKKSSSEKISIPVEEGKVYWRIYPETDTENKTSGDVNVIKVSSVGLIAPADKSALKLKDKLALNFSWEQGTQAAHYKFQLAKDTGFTNIVAEEIVYDEKFNYVLSSEDQILSVDTYYWRVVPYYAVGSEGYKNPSSYFTFTVEKENPSEVVRPELIYPSNNLEIITKSEDTQLTFMWESAVSMSEYKLQVSKSRDFSNCVINQNVKQTVSVQQINNKLFAEGTYYWKVTGYSGANEPSGESVAKSFVVKNESAEPVALVLPEDMPVSEEKSAIEIAMENAGVPLEITKQKNEIAASVIPTADPVVAKADPVIPTAAPVIPTVAPVIPTEVEESSPLDSARGDKNSTAITKTDPVVAKADPVIKTEGSVIPTESPVIPTAVEESSNAPVVETKVVERKTLSEPVLVEPAKDAKIDTEYIKTNRMVVFIWNEVPEATDYTFDLYQVLSGGSKKRVYQQKNIATNRYEFTELKKLQNGTFEWRITAYKHTGNAETAIHSKQSVQTFSIQIGLPSKVNTIDPGKQYGD